MGSGGRLRPVAADNCCLRPCLNRGLRADRPDRFFSLDDWEREVLLAHISVVKPVGPHSGQSMVENAQNGSD